MKAISIGQPWATLVAIGAKRIETRSWTTHYYGHVAIHAGKKFPADARTIAHEVPSFYRTLATAALPDGWDDILPLGAVLAIAKLERSFRFPPGPIDALIREHSDAPHEAQFGNFTAGRYGFVLTDVQILPKPIPAKGALGLWEWYR